MVQSFYGVGSAEVGFDVSIVNVSAGNFAFQRMDFELDVQLNGPPNYENKCGFVFRWSRD